MIGLTLPAHRVAAPPHSKRRSAREKSRMFSAMSEIQHRTGPGESTGNAAQTIDFPAGFAEEQHTFAPGDGSANASLPQSKTWFALVEG
jgi:hypothetical protein